MAIQETLEELEDQAREAARDWQLRAAAILYERARRLALEGGLPGAAFKFGRRAAHEWMLLGDLHRSMSLLLEIESDSSAALDAQEIARAHALRFTVMLRRCVDLAKLEDRLARLREQAADVMALGGMDIPYYEGQLLSYQGRFDEALERYEVAWGRDSVASFSVTAAGVVGAAFTTALRCGRRGDAGQWLHRSSDETYWTAWARLFPMAARAQCALWDNDAVSARAAALALAAQPALAGQLKAAVSLLVAACSIVVPDYGDPAASDHPASVWLLEPSPFLDQQPKVDYEWYLVRAIHRLAALRHSAGVAPVDDVYYQSPQRVVPPVPTRVPELAWERVTAARTACQTLKDRAAPLDRTFRTDWYGSVATDLSARVEEIVESLPPA